MCEKSRELERQFFDRLAKKIEISPASAILDLYTQYALGLVGDFQGKKVLDLGCGDGKTTYIIEKRGGSVTGIDISLEMLRRAKEPKKECEKLSFLMMDSENVGFGDLSFDIVFGGYILHHVDFSLAIKEIHRVLKKGGMGVFIENFAFNPILTFFRKHLTGKFGIPRYGTLNEHPLTYRDLREAKSLFEKVEIRNPDLNFIKLFDRQIFRYRYPIISNSCELFDRWIYYSFKGLRRFSYTQVMVVRKECKNNLTDNHKGCPYNLQKSAF